jgi:phosphoribosylformylglycinamidine synthase
VFFRADGDRQQMQALHDLLVDPLLQTGDWTVPTGVAVETALLPGVTDASAQAVSLAAATIGLPVSAVATGKRFEIEGDVDEEVLAQLAKRLLANPVIEHWSVGPIEPTFVDADAVGDTGVELVELEGLDDEALLALNQDRGLSLDLAELRAIVEHFRSAGRAPTDVELETLAQTWSEHCAHKTFRARLTDQHGSTITPLMQQLRDATTLIDAPFLRSAFVGNAGIVSFSSGTTIAVKAETHNHPSAIEPFGGANTGVGGVIRDVMGLRTIPSPSPTSCASADRLDAATLPGRRACHPRLVEGGVVAGVADYGNKIGLPHGRRRVLYDPGATPPTRSSTAGCIGVRRRRRPTRECPASSLATRWVVGGRHRAADGPCAAATFSERTMDATTG